MTMQHYSLIQVTEPEVLTSIEDSFKADAILLECSSVQLPIVLLTTKNQIEELVNRLELTANDYRMKPISKEEFLTHLKKQIDISKLKTESVQLEIEKQANELASQTKTEFFANMSHELRTPLNGILGYAQILRRAQNIDENQLRGLNAIYQSGKHLLMLINDILELSKMEAHKLALYPETVHLSSFIEGITGISRLRAEQKNISFSYEAIGDLPVGINVDEKRLRQLLIHLLNNAITFTDTGQVIFRVVRIIDKNDSVKKGTIPFNRNISESVTFRFEIEDTGVGMTPEQLKKIFLPFEQVGDAICQAEATGLGLAISRQLVELMGGEIFVESEENKGSFFCFEITLPVVDAEATDGQQLMTRRVTGYQGERKSILVVDDRSDNRVILSNILTEIGFQVIEASNGKESVEQAKKNQPAVILMDLVMPVMTGFEAVQIIRKIPGSKKTLIIATSASVFEADQEKSLIAGCDVFLPKPIEEDKLLKILINSLKLEWTYADIVEEASQKEVSDAPLIIPPPAELEAVYELAMEGRMRQVREKAAHIEELDEKYIPFARKIQQLAKSFEDEQIIALVEKYLEENISLD
jgi:signal transduction histidine kinase/ActR/RegA family two-component response regulator